MRAAERGDVRFGYALAGDFGDHSLFQIVGDLRQMWRGGLVKWTLDALAARCADVGQTHAIGGQQRGHRVDEHRLDRKRVGDVAGVLAAGAAETVQRIARDVIAARDRDFLDRLGHLRHRDRDEAVGDFLRASAVADLARKRLE
jgi:hypothetical protein